MTLIIESIALIILLMLSAFFSGVETAFVSISTLRIHHLVGIKAKNAQLVKKLRDNYQELIITLLIGNNLVNIAASSIATTIAIELFGSKGVGIAIGVMTFIVLVWGEITPKTIAMAQNERICLMTAPIIYWLSIILTPAIKLLEFLTRAIARPTQGKVAPKITEEEIKSAVVLGEIEGEVEEDEREMITNIFEFSDMQVKRIIIPMSRVVSIYEEDTVKKVLPKIHRKRFSRVPVFSKEDKVFKGIVTMKDLTMLAFKAKDDVLVKDVMKPVVFVPDTIYLDDLLRQMQKKKTHMAIVKNDKDIAVGIVTLEDVLEEIVGEIYDETDIEKDLIKQLDDTTYLVKGETNLKEIQQMCKLRIHNKNRQYKTLETVIRNKLKREPKVGDSLTINNAQITIIRNHDRMMQARMRMTKKR